MEKIHTSPYVTVYLNPSARIMQGDWTEATVDMVEQDYKDELMTILSLIKLHEPKGYVANLQPFRFTIRPELQEWSNNSFLAKLAEIGIQRFAIVVSTELITQLSIEQTIEEDTSGSFATQYFDSVEEARKWLLK